ncbi:hypothetical protein PC128_g168 [Phytophthora cactorum]|nr:hypothetical protein PC128_g168 [Phytophthora cactorum]
MKLWRRVFRAHSPLELRDRTANLGQSVSPSETLPGTRLYVYLLSCVISALNLNVVMNVMTLMVSQRSYRRYACTPCWASPRFAQLSSESNRVRRAVVAARAERYPPYGLTVTLALCMIV